MRTKLYKTTIIFFIFFGGCVSKNKYNQLYSLEKRKDSLLKTNKILSDSIINKLTQKNQTLTNQLLKLSETIEQMADNSKIPLDRFLPIIPNPPPQPTSYVIFNEKKIGQFKNYGKIDSLISSAMKKSHIDKKVYMAFKHGGFAISTPVQELNSDGNFKRTEIDNNKTLSSFLRNLFSQEHINELFFTRSGRFNCVIFIVSPNIYSLGGQTINGDQVAAWVNANNIRLPAEIALERLPPSTQCVALLYEFEQKENLRGKLRLLNQAQSKTNFNKNKLIENLQWYIN